MNNNSQKAFTYNPSINNQEQNNTKSNNIDNIIGFANQTEQNQLNVIPNIKDNKSDFKPNFNQLQTEQPDEDISPVNPQLNILNQNLNEQTNNNSLNQVVNTQISNEELSNNNQLNVIPNINNQESNLNPLNNNEQATNINPQLNILNKNINEQSNNNSINQVANTQTSTEEVSNNNQLNVILNITNQESNINTLNNNEQITNINPQLNILNNVNMNDNNGMVTNNSNYSKSFDNITITNDDEIKIESNNRFINDNYDTTSTILNDLNVDGEYNNIPRVDYSMDPKVVKNMEADEKRKKTVTITQETKVFLIIIAILLVAIFIIPSIYDLIRNTGQ